MPTQTQSGKAFEYALIYEAYNILSAKGLTVHLIDDTNYATSLACFNIFNAKQQSQYSKAAIAALNHIILLEPKLVTPINDNDILVVQLQPDDSGRNGDVRDLLFKRPAQNWEIGISAKNNHKALKHSRLSNIKDFGKSWVNVPCSPMYFDAINPIFTELTRLKDTGAKWKELSNKHAVYYQPILNAFKEELTLINAQHTDTPQHLIAYLIGRHDFYKVMKRPKVVEVLAFNIHGTLGKGKGIAPVPKLALPTEIIRFQMMTGKTDTLSMICSEGWQLSFRIHNAETLVVPSLKFDVNLVGNPNTMYSNHIPY